ncbi:hypothetical protein LINGRAHAP2_LOCUS15330 [Linum grandiflorum]
MISLLSWNARGAGHKNFFAAFRSYASKFRPNIVFVFEPRISGVKAARVTRRMDFDRCFRVYAMGFSGGIWVLWHSHLVTLQVLSSSPQCVHLSGMVGLSNNFFLIAVYRNPGYSVRQEFLEDLRSTIPPVGSAWLIARDFNDMLASADKRGGAPFSLRKHLPFIEWCSDCGLSDLGFIGSRFTWFRGVLRERIDHALANSAWTLLFPDTSVAHPPRTQSDHRPIFISTSVVVQTSLPKPFRFIMAWLEHEKFNDFIKGIWEVIGNLNP